MAIAAPETRCSSCACSAFHGDGQAAYCGTCGHPRSAHHGDGFRCASCRTPVGDEVAFCTGCGAPIDRRFLRAATDRAEVVGDALGRGVGRAASTAIATAAAPVYQKVWSERPSIPAWQKMLGFFAWPLGVLTPHGLVFIGGSFAVMVILGRHNPYQWFAWATKWLSILFLVTVAAAAVFGLILLQNQ
jgi:hypothetical protein